MPQPSSSGATLRELARGTLDQFVATGDGCFIDNADPDTLRAMVRLMVEDDERAEAELGRAETDICEIHDALAEPGKPSAINADWIIERIGELRATIKESSDAVK